MKVEKRYSFDGPNGKQTLAELFDGRSQLIVYHFMLGPGWEQGCPSCSYLADHFDGAAIHLPLAAGQAEEQFTGGGSRPARLVNQPPESLCAVTSSIVTRI